MVGINQLSVYAEQKSVELQNQNEIAVFRGTISLLCTFPLEPLEGVEVFIECGGSSQTVDTNSDGVYNASFPVPPVNTPSTITATWDVPHGYSQSMIVYFPDDFEPENGYSVTTNDFIFYCRLKDKRKDDSNPYIQK
jgi:hypothetical protein